MSRNNDGRISGRTIICGVLGTFILALTGITLFTVRSFEDDLWAANFSNFTPNWNSTEAPVAPPYINGVSISAIACIGASFALAVSLISLVYMSERWLKQKEVMAERERVAVGQRAFTAATSKPAIRETTALLGRDSPLNAARQAGYGAGDTSVIAMNDGDDVSIHSDSSKLV